MTLGLPEHKLSEERSWSFHLVRRFVLRTLSHYRRSLITLKCPCWQRAPATRGVGWGGGESLRSLLTVLVGLTSELSRPTLHIRRKSPGKPIYGALTSGLSGLPGGNCRRGAAMSDLGPDWKKQIQLVFG